MIKTTPRILSGFMELLPSRQVAFNRIKEIIKTTYESFGYSPLDTPAMELSEVLLAKAGGETEKQIYRFTKGDTDISMRFDLTVPLARFVSMHQGELTFPFKRYQIGKVYRGERAQKGRYREFYQCDIDVIGSEALDISYDAEVLAIIYRVFSRLGLSRFKIKLNNRRILKGFFSSLKLEDKVTEVLRIIDKLDKIGIDNVKAELQKLSVAEDAVDKILLFVSQKGENDEQLSFLRSLGIDDENFNFGVDELEKVLDLTSFYGVPKENVSISLNIARGLDYYTGTVYETELTDIPEAGSVCSGGRYDDLTGFYSDKKMPGVGVSIGLTRLFSQLLDKGMIKPCACVNAAVAVLPVSESEKESVLSFAELLRRNKINAVSFTEDKKFKAKMNYANKIGVPFAAIIGESEAKSNSVVIKNMQSGEQNTLSVAEAVDFLGAENKELLSESPLCEIAG
jgi:histidyl-tRNA synthetase